MVQQMSDGRHPDLNLLSAFVERSLKDAEREDVLRHLAVCDRCREIVFFAQDAEPEPVEALLEVAAAAPQNNRSDKVRLAWWPWRIAWVTVPSLCAIALAFLSLHWYGVWTSHNPPSDGSSPKQVAIGSGQPKQPPQPAIAAEIAAENAPQKPKAERFEKHTIPERRSHLSQIQPGVVGGAMGRATEDKAAHDQNAARSGESTSAQTIATEAPPASPQQGPPQSVSQTVEVSAAQPPLEPQNQDVTATIPSERDKRPAAVAANRGIRSAPMRAPSASTQAQAASPASPAPMQSVVLPAPVLPGAHAVISIISSSSSGKEAALDTEGTLFLRSGQAGEWRKVPVQWTGKAVSLSTISRSASGHLFSKAAPLSGAASSTPTQPAPMWKLTNDAGQAWTSHDAGETWQAQPVIPQKP